MYTVLVNPITLWLRWLAKKVYWEFRYRKQHLLLEYMADVEKCKFGMYNKIYKNTRLFEVDMGDYSYVSKESQIKRTKIKKFCTIGPKVWAGLGMHPSSEFVSIHPVFYSNLAQSQITFYKENIFEEYAPIEIGNDVWIGANVLVHDGVKIGDGAIIAAGAVVTKDVEPYAIVGGVPAKLIKYRFEPEEIAFLLEFKWWDKDISWIRDNKELFKNIKLLMKKYK